MLSIMDNNPVEKKIDSIGKEIVTDFYRIKWIENQTSNNEILFIRLYYNVKKWFH